MTHFQQLPPEVKCMILSYLKEKKDLFNAALVCSEWSNLVNIPSMWKDFHLDITIEKVCNVNEMIDSPRFKGMRKVRLAGDLTEEAVENVCSRLLAHDNNIEELHLINTNLVKLDLSMLLKKFSMINIYECFVDQDLLEKMMKEMPHPDTKLRSLYLGETDLTRVSVDYFPSFSVLSSLEIGGYNIPTISSSQLEALFSIFSVANNLKVFQLYNVDLSPLPPKLFEAAMRSLEALRLALCDVTTSQLEAMLEVISTKEATNLTNLQLLESLDKIQPELLSAAVTKVEKVGLQVNLVEQDEQVKHLLMKIASEDAEKMRLQHLTFVDIYYLVPYMNNALVEAKKKVKKLLVTSSYDDDLWINE